MAGKKALIICQSVHHGNTMKVAKAMAQVLDAEIIKPSEADAKAIASHDLIGFGSGIYKRRHHRGLFELVGRLPAQKHKKVFVFSTSTYGMKGFHEPLRSELAGKGFDVIGEFACRGFINYSFIKLMFGGLSKGRPNGKDLEKARDFATGMKGRI